MCVPSLLEVEYIGVHTLSSQQACNYVIYTINVQCL